MNQYTIMSELVFEGLGLHTGENCKVTLLPAGINEGIKFGGVENPEKLITADVSSISSTDRCTTIESGELKISTVEHLMSALYGLGVSNCTIIIDGSEIPILDGSSYEFAKKIKEVGLKDQGEEAKVYAPKKIITFQGEDGSEITIIPQDYTSYHVSIDFNSKVLPPQSAYFTENEDYVGKVSRARTFVFLHELETLIEYGLVKGGDLDNAVVYVEELIPKEHAENLAKKLGKELIEISTEGILNTTELRYSNEAAIHKLLDFMGDVALSGVRLVGKIFIHKPGHTLNKGFAQLIKKEYLALKKLRNKPEYNPDEPPLYDLERIKANLPHRFPFLLVDKIIELSDTHVVGVKNITADQYFFQGHFPNNPVFPGVLQVEALAQTGGILIMSTVEDPGNWDTYFLKIDGVKFKQKVLPGDTLIMKMELMSPIRRGLCHMFGTAYVGNNIVSEGELIAQVVRRRDKEN